MKRRFRLVRSVDFQRVRQYGKAYTHSMMVLVVLPNESEAARIGVVAGRSVGNAAKRNRAKRLLRHAVRPMIATISQGWDLVLIARRPMVMASMSQVQAVLSVLLRRANLLNEQHELEKG